MQTLCSIASRHTDDLLEVFMEMRGHLYLHAGTLLLKLAQDRQQSWRAISDQATLCYLLAYQVLCAWLSLCSALLKHNGGPLHLDINKNVSACDEKD